MRNPFRRRRAPGGFILGSGFFLGNHKDDAALLALGAEYNTATTEAERRDIDARILARLEEMNRAPESN